MEWLPLVLIGGATAAICLSLPAIRWDMLHILHRFHVQAVTALVAEEAAADGLAEEIETLKRMLVRVKAEEFKLHGDWSADNHRLTQPGQPPIHGPGGDDRGRGGRGAGAADQS